MRKRCLACYLILLVFLSALYGCNGASVQGNTYRGRAYGFSFDFPEGWYPLSASEVEQRFGKPESKLLICIGDPERERLMHVAKLNAPMADSVKAIEPAVRYFDENFSDKVEGYRRIRLGEINVRGKGMVELVFEKTGRMSPVARVTQIYFANRGYFLCLTFGAPSGGQPEDDPALDSILRSWKWFN